MLVAIHSHKLLVGGGPKPRGTQKGLLRLRVLENAFERN